LSPAAAAGVGVVRTGGVALAVRVGGGLEATGEPLKEKGTGVAELAAGGGCVVAARMGFAGGLAGVAETEPPAPTSRAALSSGRSAVFVETGGDSTGLAGARATRATRGATGAAFGMAAATLRR